MRYTVRPISDRTWLGTMGKEPTRFSSKWASTLDLLEREIEFLDGRDIVLEIDVTEGDLKLDGQLRADARPSSSAVRVAFESKHGPLIYRCDRFYTNWAHQGPEWQHNVRAIALTLEALRSVDRYGATETGQQYTGFKALPAGRAMPASHMTSDRALTVLAEAISADNGIRVYPADVRSNINSGLWQAMRRRLIKVAHPDNNDGDQKLWDQVVEAARMLGVQL